MVEQISLEGLQELVEEQKHNMRFAYVRHYYYKLKEGEIRNFYKAVDTGYRLNNILHNRGYELNPLGFYELVVKPYIEEE